MVRHGKHGSQVHLGNNPELADPLYPGRASKEGTQNVTSLEASIQYVPVPGADQRYRRADDAGASDAHEQPDDTNRVGRAHRAAGREGHAGPGGARERINGEIEEMVGYMLFVDEEPLKEPVKGVSTFTKTVRRTRASGCQGPVAEGFRFAEAAVPLSVVVLDLQRGVRWDAGRGSGAGLPAGLRGSDWARTKNRPLPEFRRVDRRAVLQIVRATKQGLPKYWRQFPRSAE